MSDPVGAYFAAVNAEVNRLVDGLKQLGFNAGDRMVWCGPNSREVLVTIHAGRKLGLVSVPLSYRFNAEEMQYIIENSGASLVIVERARSYAAFERAYARLGFELPLFERVLVVVASPHLHNLLPNPAPDTTMWNAADWWLD